MKEVSKGMSPKWCPGSVILRQPKPELFRCQSCGSEVEIWSDEATRPCPSCGKDVFRAGTQSCLDWCRLAKECVGEDRYKRYGEMKTRLRKQALVGAMEKYFGNDVKRINHANAVIAYAEAILKETDGADPNVVISAAALHDIGIKNAEQKYGSSAPEHQEIEGPPVARVILTDLGYEEPFIHEVCDIVGHHHHPRAEESVNFDALYDADLLTNLSEARQCRKAGNSAPSPSAHFRTLTGRQIALSSGLITGEDCHEGT